MVREKRYIVEERRYREELVRVREGEEERDSYDENSSSHQ